MGVRRRSFVAVAGLTALSGCLSVDDITSRARGEVSDRAGDELRDRTGFDVETPEEPPETDEEWRLYEFEPGERYEYRIDTEEDGPGTFSWTIKDAGEDRLVVDTELTFESGDKFARTATGTQDEVFSELMATPSAIFIGSGLHSPYVTANEGVYVGHEWRVATDEGSFRYAVEDTDSYVGTDCYVTVTEIDGAVVHESCLSPDLAFPAFVVYYDESGEQLLEMELLEYESPSGES
ncbi:hypothetical protein GWG54_05405 [Natronococcus sp. JC468]|uniref:hypothetical protein n=1 Tax=Natronococcus sp. JC468 TaxID=1961921 RepID=UPI0014387CE6|nr:hypothetical protein [Natronococcus sp. JC468]NKE35257.1 hypothetical protein [Natronococcus sp. JC468]